MLCRPRRGLDREMSGVPPTEVGGYSLLPATQAIVRSARFACVARGLALRATNLARTIRVAACPSPPATGPVSNSGDGGVRRSKDAATAGFEFRRPRSASQESSPRLQSGVNSPQPIRDRIAVVGGRFAAPDREMSNLPPTEVGGYSLLPATQAIVQKKRRTEWPGVSCTRSFDSLRPALLRALPASLPPSTRCCR